MPPKRQITESKSEIISVHPSCSPCAPALAHSLASTWMLSCSCRVDGLSSSNTQPFRCFHSIHAVSNVSVASPCAWSWEWWAWRQATSRWSRRLDQVGGMGLVARRGCHAWLAVRRGRISVNGASSPPDRRVGRVDGVGGHACAIALQSSIDLCWKARGGV
jgi:hypothetical protein